MKNYFLFLSLVVLLSACKGTKDIGSGNNPDANSPTLLSFKKENVSKAEFERVYAKNNGGLKTAKGHSKAEYQEYLDLYINFKRKVFEAEARGLDTMQSFKQEFATYQKQLAQPYLRAKEVEDRLVKEAYNRSRYVVKASHLLINVGADASPADTLVAYNKVMGYRDSVLSGGKDFAYMAGKYSEDPSAKDNKGDLGYFSAFNMVYPFESGAFKTPVGQVSRPIRTRFGYHLIKVNDKVETGGPKRVAHIIVRIGERFSAKDSAQAVARINEIYTKLRAGEDFSALAERYSDDPASATKGGDLGTSRLLPEMETLKLKLKQGEYSQPFGTRFGWHILKVTESSLAKTFEESQADIRRKIERDSRSQISRDALIDRIKKDYGFEHDEAALNAFKGIVTANFIRGNWEPKPEDEIVLGLGLLSLKGDKTFRKTNRDFYNFYKETRPRSPSLNSFQAVDQLFAKYVNEALISYEEAKLPEKNPDYRHLLKEYHDGILLFTLMEQMVWKKAVEDTLGLENYYENHKEDFYENRSIDAKEYRSEDASVMDKVLKLLKLGATEHEIDSLINKNSSLKLSIRTITLEDGKSDVSPLIFDKELDWYGDIESLEGGAYRLLQVAEKRAAGIKDFERARPEAITKYQDYLEEEWLRDLEYKYPVDVKQNILDTLFK